MMPELGASSCNVGRLDIGDLNYQVRYADLGVAESPLPWLEPEIFRVRAHLCDRFQVHFGQIVADSRS